MGFIVGVEKKVVGLVEGTIRGVEGDQYKGFKKPADVGNVPLGRAYVGHALNDVVFLAKRRTQGLRRFADALIITQPFLGVATIEGCFMSSLGEG
jgi:hypothetical protein